MAGELDRPAKSRQRKMTVADKERFLEELRKGRTVRLAAEAAHHPPTSFYWHRKNDPEFAAAVEEAIAIGTDVIEDEAFRRGVEGVVKKVYGKVAPGIDGVIGEEIVYSDRMLEVMLKGRRPEYRDNPKVQIDNKTLNVTIEDRSAALEDVARVLREAGALENNRASDGEVISGAGLLLAESEDV